MPTIRYYKATDGQVTVFRATATREYQSAWFTSESTDGRARLYGGLGFSAKPVPTGKYPATEITKAEYDALVTAKNERVTGMGWKPRNHTSPQASWVRNADLEG